MSKKQTPGPDQGSEGRDRTDTSVDAGSPEENAATQDEVRRPVEGAVLLLSVFAVASCGIAYELVIGATGAYISGDGVTQFSLTIGVYLFAMGLGSFLSRRVTTNLLPTFISVELVVGLAGGFANTILFLVYGFMTGYEVVFYTLLVFVGIMIGLEVPLLLRLLSQYGSLRINVANVLGLDYVGALLVAVAFPLVLLPALGLMRTSLLFGILNVAVAGGNLIFFRKRRLSKALPVVTVAALLALLVAFGYTNQLVRLGEAEQYDDEIILTRQTRYQRIVVTRWRSEIRLFLDRNIQFSSRDEYRYHEALVHPALSTIPNRDRILILGGGDGLGLREVLKYPDVKEVTLVDLDKEMVDLCRTNKHIRRVNKDSLSSKRVKLVYQDAWTWLKKNHGRYNAILVDMPDPSSEKVAKLYSLGFYRMCRRHLAADGALVVQSTSPYFSPGAFWCINETLRAAKLHVTPIHVHVPTFGTWGFNLASFQPMPWRQARPKVKTRYLNSELWPTLFRWPGDLPPLKVDISTLDNPRAIYYYNRGYREHFRARTGDAAKRRHR